MSFYICICIWLLCLVLIALSLSDCCSLFVGPSLLHGCLCSFFFSRHRHREYTFVLPFGYVPFAGYLYPYHHRRRHHSNSWTFVSIPKDFCVLDRPSIHAYPMVRQTYHLRVCSLRIRHLFHPVEHILRFDLDP